MQIRFLGAAGTVTGSKYLVTQGNTKLLIDCGLYQGHKELRLRNWRNLPFDVSEIDAVIITHAHIDHSGYLPVFIKNGFRGKIYATPPTRALCSVLLPDSGRIHEEDANYANKHGFSKHKPALPLYTAADGEAAMGFFEEVELGEERVIGELKFSFGAAGHILGAANVTLKDRHTSVLFSGDIGRYHDLVEVAPQRCRAADFVVMESTYGDRVHGKDDPVELIAQLMADVIAKNSLLLIPAFAVGRSQSMIYCISEAFDRGLVKRIPVYLNSPMAVQVTRLYERFPEWHKLDGATCRRVFGMPKYVTTMQDSQALNRVKGPAVIISASGMLTGGRVLHHLKEIAPNPDHTILLPGFQAPGTRGATLAEGGTRVKVHGEYVPVRARVVHIDMFSAHADQNELLYWLKSFEELPRKVLLVHGEPNASFALAEKIKEQLGVEVDIPEYEAVFNTY
jgi:metallo-beta-lactamase family protein